MSPRVRRCALLETGRVLFWARARLLTKCTAAWVGPELAAAVTNAGGLGVIGGVGYTPKMLQRQVDELKSYLHDKNVCARGCLRGCRASGCTEANHPALCFLGALWH